MVKRRDKTARRQILQLEDKKPPPVVTKAPMKGLIHYSDSDEESNTPPGPESSGVPINENISTTSSAPIDSQVADFLKEIDALTVQTTATEEPESSEADLDSKACAPSSSNDESSHQENGSFPQDNDENKEENMEFNNVETSAAPTQGDMSLCCVWQECRDDSTGYSYYWNIQTNEVTWECPPEYLAYLHYLNSAADTSTVQISQSVATTSEGVSSSKKTKSKKDNSSGLEGKIIPISYFGGSSSSDDSSDDSSIECSSEVKGLSKSNVKKSCHKISNISKAKNLDKEHPKCSKVLKETGVPIVESIGPQLPPDFQFSDDIPVTPTPSNSSLDGIPYNDKNEEEVCEIGPQLPSYYLPKEVKVKDIPVSLDQETLVCEGIDLVKASASTENPSYNGECTQDPSQSTVNGVEVQTPSNENETWEESLLKIERQFKGLEKFESNEEEPDSTTKKDIAQPKQKVVDSSLVHCKVLKPVVGYDSDSDYGHNILVSSQPSEKLCKKETERDIVDSIFSLAHTTGKKFGFGFAKNKQFEIESTFLEGGGVQSSSTSRRKNNSSNYPRISFVKSKEVLDLNVLNVPASQQEDSEPAKEPAEAEVKTKVQGSERLPLDRGEVDMDEIDQALENALLNKGHETSVFSKEISEPSTSGICSGNSKKHPVEESDTVEVSSPKRLKKDEPDQSPDASTDLMTNILELSSLLVDKLTFLLSSQSTMTSLTSILIQIQTRVIDWQAGALESKYCMDRLQEVEQYLHHYEMGAVSGDWICQWDRYGLIECLSSFFWTWLCLKLMNSTECDYGYFAKKHYNENKNLIMNLSSIKYLSVTSEMLDTRGAHILFIKKNKQVFPSVVLQTLPVFEIIAAYLNESSVVS